MPYTFAAPRISTSSPTKVFPNPSKNNSRRWISSSCSFDNRHRYARPTYVGRALSSAGVSVSRRLRTVLSHLFYPSEDGRRQRFSPLVYLKRTFVRQRASGKPHISLPVQPRTRVKHSLSFRSIRQAITSPLPFVKGGVIYNCSLADLKTGRNY
ncbi:MAG: hypothetical protein ACLRSW_14645 [Christensenellaceae bacterium]